MSSPPSTLKDLYRSSDAQAYRAAAAAGPEPAPAPAPARSDGVGRIPFRAEEGANQSAVSESASRTEDLEHLFGGSDLSTAVKALYDFDAPHEFFGSLNRFVKRKDAEIEDVCSKYYQEFIRSNQELLGVRVDIRELRGQVTGLNDEIQEAGKVYLQKCEQLIELRQMRHNSRQFVAELKGCCKVLEMCACTTAQMAGRQYYPALKTLQQLDQKYLPELSAHAFVSEVADRIPALQAEIKQRVLSEFLEWLATVADVTHDVGEHSLAWMVRQKNAIAQFSGGNGDAAGSPDTAERERRRSSVASIASSASRAMENIGRDRDSFASLASDGGGRVSSSGGSGRGEHSPTDTEQNSSVFEMVHLHFEPLYECVHIFETLGKLGELREIYATRRRAQLESAEKDLKSRDTLDIAAAETAAAVASAAAAGGRVGSRGGGAGPLDGGISGVDQEVFGPQFSEDMDNFLKHLAGFFIVEDTVLQTATSFANGPGAVDPHALWSAAMVTVRSLVERGFALMRDPLYMLHLKRALDNFVALMTAHGYYGVPLLQLLERTQGQYEHTLLAARGKTITVALEQQNWAEGPVRVSNVANWEAYILPHWRTLHPSFDVRSKVAMVGAPPPDAFTKQYVFSTLVPCILTEAKAMIAEYSDYAREWPEFAVKLTQLVDKLLRQELRQALASSLPVRQRTILQAVQLTADMGVLKESCTELEDVIAAQLERGIDVSLGLRQQQQLEQDDSIMPAREDTKRTKNDGSIVGVGQAHVRGKANETERPLAAARKALDILRTENEDLVMQLMDTKLQELSGQQSKLASTTLWVSGAGAEQEIAAHLKSIAAFFAETMRAMEGVLEPAVIDGAFFAAFSTLNNRLSAIFTAADLSYAPRRISAAAVHAVADGLDALREFSDSCQVESLSLLLDEAQQVVALLVQATAWVEAQCISGGGGGRPDDEGGFLEADVRGIVFPRLSLETIATVLDKLDFPSDPSESRQVRQARYAAEGALRKCAQQLVRSEGAGYV